MSCEQPESGHCSSAEQRRGLLARCQVSISLFAARRGVWFAYLIAFGFGAVKNNQKVLDTFHANADSGIPASLEPAERKPFLSSLQPDACSSQASLVQALCRGPSRSSAWLTFGASHLVRTRSQGLTSGVRLGFARVSSCAQPDYSLPLVSAADQVPWHKGLGVPPWLLVRGR